MHVKACKKTAKRRRAAAFELRKDGTELHLGGGKTVCGCVWAMERRCTAACGLQKGATELHLGDIAPAITRHAAEYVLQQEFYHVPHGAQKHVPMQEKHLAHAIL